MSNSPLNPNSVFVDSRLSHDILLLQGIAVKPSLESQTAVAIDSVGNQFYFAVLPDIGLVELEFSAGLGSAASVLAIEGGSDATEVIAFFDWPNDQESGYLHVFWATPTATQHIYRTTSGDWIGPASLPALSGLCISQRAAVQYKSAAILAVGIASNGVLNVLLPSAWYDSSRTPGPDYYCFPLKEPGSLAGEDYAAVSLSGDTWLFATDGKSGIRVLNLEAAGSNGWITISTNGIAVNRLLGVQSLQSTTEQASILAFTDLNGGLYAGIVDQTGTTISVGTIATESDIVSGSIRTWVNQACRIYAISADETLFVAQMTGLDSNSVPTFTGLLPLDVGVTYAAGAFPRLGTTIGSLSLLATRNDGSLDLMNQNSDSGLWTRLPINQSSASIPLQIDQYRSRVEVTDANGMPCPGISLSITPESALAFEVGGNFIAATPNTPALLTTDAAGAVEICQPATGLSSVRFEVSVTGLDPVVPVTPHGYITSLLAAQPGSEIYTGSSNIPLMTGPVLLDATVNGVPLAPSLADTTLYPDPQTAAASYATWINLMAGQPGSNGSAGFTLDLTTPGGPTLIQHASSDALYVHLQRQQERLLGSIWSDIAGIAGDIWHAIKHAAIEIATVTVDTVKAVATFVVKIGDELVTLAGLALAGIHEVISTVHGVLATIGADIDKAIDWLKDILNWSNIWNTMEVFDGYLTSCLDQIAAGIPVAQSKANEFFSGLKSDVNSAFEQAEADLGKTNLSNGTNTLSAKRTRLLGGASLPPPVALAGSSAQRNWLKSKIQTHFNSNSYLPSQGTIDISNLFTDFSNALTSTTIISDLENALSEFQKFLLDIANPKDLWNVAVVDLLDALRSFIDVVLDIADAIVETGLALASQIINLTQTLLNTPLPDIPLISWLWENVLRPSGKSDPLTIGALACLAIAVPATLIGEIATGSNPFLNLTSTNVDAVEQGLGNALVTALDIISPLLCAIDVVNDCTNAAAEIPTPETIVTNAFDLAMNIVVQGLSYPGNNASAEAKAVWSCSFLPLGVDAVLWGISFKQTGNSDFNETVGDIPTWSDCVAGILAIVGGIIAVSQLPTRQTSDWLDAILDPVAWATQPLTLQSAVEETEGFSLAVQAVFDAVSDVGSLIWDPSTA